MGQRVGVWSEVKIKYAVEAAEDPEVEEDKYFDYTFDYIVAPFTTKSADEVSRRLNLSLTDVETFARKNSLKTSTRNGVTFIDEYPGGTPSVIEVMTSSTSGGNKRKGNTIQDAFKDSVLGKDHSAPGINYRQVWARMVSQLIVKSQIGNKWGGVTLWILQDELAKYISRTTDLNLQKLISDVMREVNILSLGYSGLPSADGTEALKKWHLFAGLVPPITGDTDFNKLLQAASVPPREVLEAKLLVKEPRVKLTVS